MSTVTATGGPQTRATGGWLPTELQPLWRRVLWARFLLLQRRRHRRLVLETVAGIPVLILPDVFNPALFGSSEALIRHFQRDPRLVGSTVLDLGTGCSIVAIAAARLGAWVTAVDVAPAAVRCARINVALNEVEENVEVLHGDLFEPVAGRRFDLVLFNPPYYRGCPRAGWETAWRSEDVIERFGAGLPAVLAPGGRAVLVVSSDVTGVEECCAAHGFTSRVLWERRGPAESLKVVEWTRSEEAP